MFNNQFKPEFSKLKKIEKRPASNTTTPESCPTFIHTKNPVLVSQINTAVL
jgi:hypothetical protein